MPKMGYVRFNKTRQTQRDKPRNQPPRQRDAVPIVNPTLATQPHPVRFLIDQQKRRQPHNS